MSRWFFMTVVFILFPLAMILLGLWFRVKPPGRPKEKVEVWWFAQRHLGRTWLFLGGPMLILSIIALLIVKDRDQTIIMVVGLVLNTFQTMALFASSYPTQRSIKRHFDDEGNPRNPGAAPANPGKEDQIMELEVLEWPSFSVMGMRYSIDQSEILGVLPDLWERAWESGRFNHLSGLNTDLRPPGFIGMLLADPDQAGGGVDYVIGVVSRVDRPTSKQIQIPEEMEEFHLPAASWAILKVNRAMPGSMQPLYEWFYSSWLPDSGYLPAALPVIECYLEGNRGEIWFPVTK